MLFKGAKMVGCGGKVITWVIVEKVKKVFKRKRPLVKILNSSEAMEPLNTQSIPFFVLCAPQSQM